MYSVHKYKTAVRNTAVIGCRKSLFFQKKCLFSIPIRTLCGLCVLQSLWAFYLGILAETPNPFPVVKGCVCFVGSASCRAFGHTRPASLPGLSVGLPPLVQARMLVVSHTKPLHDAVAQMADDLYGGYAPATPFSINKRFIDRRKPPCETRRFIAYLIVFDYLITLTEITASPALILSATLSALPLTSRTV